MVDTTTSQGSYAFDGLGSGEYTVAVIDPAGDLTKAAATVMVTLNPPSPTIADIVLPTAPPPSVTGVVRDGTAPGNPPADGVAVSGCPVHTFQISCPSTLTDATGTYRLYAFATGDYDVSAARGTSLADQAIITVRPGAPATQDFELHRPQSVAGGVSVVLPGSTVSSGIPTLTASMPFTLSVPLHVAPHAPPDSTRVDVSTAGAQVGNTGIGVAQSLIFAVHYGDDGTPDGMSRVMAAPLPSGVNLPGPWRSSGSGSHGRPCGISWGDFTIKPTSEGGIAVTVPIGPGQSLDLHLNPVELPAPTLTGDVARDFAAISATAVANTLLETALPPIHGWNQFVEAANVITMFPAASRTEVAARIAEHLAGNFIFPAIASRHVEALGYHGTIRGFAIEVAGALPATAAAANEIDDPCETVPGSPDSSGSAEIFDAGDWSMYVDPSGHVTTPTHVPLAGVRVELQRARSRRRAPEAVPTGSTVMGPGNRRNPDTTDALGSFGWDVVPGFYRVTARRPGCTARGARSVARTLTFPVPPEMTDLTLLLDCPHVRREPSRVALRVIRDPRIRTVLLYAHVGGAKRGARRHPEGIVRFTQGTRLLGSTPVDVRTGDATLPVTEGRGHNSYRVRYLGDAHYAPSSRKR
jgi:hypothetical protein